MPAFLRYSQIACVMARICASVKVPLRGIRGARSSRGYPLARIRQVRDAVEGLALEVSGDSIRILARRRLAGQR